jgi:hypothetical protein
MLRKINPKTQHLTPVPKSGRYDEVDTRNCLKQERFIQ